MRATLSLILLVLLTLAAELATSQQPATSEVFGKAARSLAGGDYQQAEAGFRQVLQTDPGNLPALGNLGVIYARTRRYALAIQTDQQALALDPSNRDLLLNLGLAYLKQDDYKRAATYFKKLNDAGSKDHRTTMLLATCLVLGDEPQAGLTLLRASEMNPDDPSVLYLLAVAYARTNQMEMGRQTFTLLLNESGTHTQAAFLLGRAYYQGGKLAEAASEFQEVARQQPDYPGLHRELAKVYITMQRNIEAERELREALRQDPQDGSAIYFLGALLVQNGKEAEGITYLQRSQIMLPDSWAPPFYLGKAQLNLGHPDSAFLYLHQAASLNGEEPAVFYLLARAARSLGKTEEAKTAMLRVAALHTNALEAEKQATEKAGIIGVR